MIRLASRGRRSFIIGVAVLFLPLLASAAPVNEVAVGSLSTAIEADFEEFPPVLVTNVDTVLASGSALFAERFAGQTLSFNGDFDVLSGTPAGPLTLQVGVPDHNLAVVLQEGTNVLAGSGADGFSPAGIGAGAVSVLFPMNLSQLAFRTAGVSGGQLTVDFFRTDGSLIDTIIISNVALQNYGFQRDGNVQDIAGISMTTDALLAYDDFRYAIPEPSTLTLAALGLIGLLACGWRRRRRT